MRQDDLPAGLMPDYRRELPAAYAGVTWRSHRHLAPGILEHTGENGEKCLTVRIILPPDGLLAGRSLRLLAGWIRKYALTGRKTSRQGFELVGVREERLQELLDEIRQAGYLVGGTGPSLHQIKCCIGFVHCQTAAVDSPSLAQALAEELEEEFGQWHLPGPLKISVAGCPNGCGGAVEADIGLTGVFKNPPQIDYQALAAEPVDWKLLFSWCPTGALQPEETPEGLTARLDGRRCLRCLSCVLVAPHGFKAEGERGVRLTVGGRGGGRPSLGRVIEPFVPVVPGDYKQVVDHIKKLIDFWRRQAKAGERLADLIKRLGWRKFVEGFKGITPGDRS